MVQGYCLKEKKKVDIKEPKYELNKKGRPIVRGKCASCGGVVYKILAKVEVPAELKAKIPAKKGGASRKSRKSTGSKKSRKSRKSVASRGGKKSRKSRKSKGSRKSRRSRK